MISVVKYCTLCVIFKIVLENSGKFAQIVYVGNGLYICHCVCFETNNQHKNECTIIKRKATNL